MKQTWLISGFPGIGKTTAFRELNGQINVIDLDNSMFDKANFVKNYMSCIKANMGVQDIIFISAQEVIRRTLVKEGLKHYLFYPSLKRKEEFLDLYYRRGNSDTFIKKIDDNFNIFIESCQNDMNPNKIELNKEGEFLLSNSLFKKIIEEIKNS